MGLVVTNTGEKFASRLLRKFYQKAVTPSITNSEYEGTISAGGGDRLSILSFLNSVSLSNYTPGTDMTTESWLGETEDQVHVDQKKYWNFAIDSIEKFESYVNDLDSALLDDASSILSEAIDTYVLGLYANVKAGHRVGSDFNSAEYATGTATVTTATGALVVADPGIGYQVSTTYNSNAGPAMVGLGIKFSDSSTYYKISTWTNSCNLIITDWNDSTYSGGTKTTLEFIIEAVYPKTASKTTIYADILTLDQYLNEDKVPKTDRWLVVSPAVAAILKQATELIPAVPVAYEDIIRNGLIGKVAGFQVFENTLVVGDSSDGWHCMAGHKSAIVFAHAFTQSRVQEAENTFAKKYQGLNVYGAVVPILRRKALAEAFWILSGRGEDYKHASGV